MPPTLQSNRVALQRINPNVNSIQPLDWSQEFRIVQKKNTRPISCGDDQLIQTHTQIFSTCVASPHMTCSFQCWWLGQSLSSQSYVSLSTYDRSRAHNNILSDVIRSNVSDTTASALKSEKWKDMRRFTKIRLQLLPALSTSLPHAEYPTARTNPTPHAIAAEIEEGGWHKVNYLLWFQ